MGFSGGSSGKESTCQCRRCKRCRFDPWVGKIPQELLLFSHSVISYSLWPYGMQPARLPGPSLSPRACSNSSPLSQWCHPTVSSSVITFSSCPQSLPASESFPMSRLFASGGQRLELQLLRQSFQWIVRTDFLYDWLVWFPCSPRNSKSLQHHGSKALAPSFKSIKSFSVQPSLWSTCHTHTWLVKNSSLIGK